MAVEVILALRLLLQFIDRGEIDLAELLDVAAHLGEHLLPLGHVGRRLQVLQDVGEHELRGRKLLGDATRGERGFLRQQAAPASIAVRASNTRCSAATRCSSKPRSCASASSRALRRVCKLRFHLQALRQRRCELLFQLQNRCIAACQLALELAAARCQAARVARTMRCKPITIEFSRRAQRFAANQQIARSKLRGLCGGARRSECLARLIAVALQLRLLRIKLGERNEPAREFDPGARCDLLRHGDLVAQRPPPPRAAARGAASPPRARARIASKLPEQIAHARDAHPECPTARRRARASASVRRWRTDAR